MTSSWIAVRNRWATRATTYLRTMQNPDGGFAYYKGGSSDINSTGLALAACARRPGSRQWHPACR